MTEKNNSDLPNEHIPARDLNALLKVSGALASTLELPQVLQTGIESVVEVLDLPTGAIYLLEGEDLILGATTPPLPVDFPPPFRFARLDQHPHIQHALRTGQPVYLPDTSQAELTEQEAAICAARGLVSILYFPLALRNTPTGVVIVGSTQGVWEFTQVEMDLSHTLSNQISLAVANARLFQSVQQANLELVSAYDATLEGWSLALELKDHETQGHTVRVANLTVELARRLGVDDPDLVQIRRGALLHDIGKMGVPDTILSKPGPLNDSEWQIMRRHPELAKTFLENIRFLQPALDIPYCHHEKWEGTGYPRGLHGKDIPYAARIFSVVDVFDALTSDRTYRKAWTIEASLHFISTQQGRYFDPYIAGFFLSQPELHGER